MKEKTQYGSNEAHGEALELQKIIEAGKASDYEEAEQVYEREKNQENFEYEIRSTEGSDYFESRLLNCSPEPLSKYKDRIEDINDRLSGMSWAEDRNARLLVAPISSSVGGQAHSAFGIYSISEKALMNDSFENSFALAVHERTHLHVASELRRRFLEENQEVDDFFHQVILPGWIKTGEDLEYDQQYVRDKGWHGLYPRWSSGSDINIDQAVKAINDYFRLLKKDLLLSFGGKTSHQGSSSSNWPELMSRDDVPLATMYQKDPEKFKNRLLTGYHLAQYFDDNYRLSMLRRVNNDFLDMEEGFANYIMTSTADIDLDTFNKRYPQDASKIAMAKQLMEKTRQVGITAEEALAEVKSFSGLVGFYKKLGLADWQDNF